MASLQLSKPPDPDCQYFRSSVSSGVFKGEAFDDAPLASHILFYEKSAGTPHGRLVRGLLLQAHQL